MSDDELEPDDGGAWVRYYLTVPNRYVREWPGGLMRRTKRAGDDSIADDAWTAESHWEATLYFVAPRFGTTDMQFPLVEVDHAEADRARQAMEGRPRGGPFTEAGQAWLAAHPEDPAAKYLGVTGPVYDFAGRLVTPMGPVPPSGPAATTD